MMFQHGTEINIPVFERYFISFVNLFFLKSFPQMTISLDAHFCLLEFFLSELEGYRNELQGSTTHPH